jgi:hypothetical protein
MSLTRGLVEAITGHDLGGHASALPGHEKEIRP